MVDPRIFLNASYSAAAVVAFTLSAGLFSLFFFLTLYLQNSLGFSPLAGGPALSAAERADPGDGAAGGRVYEPAGCAADHVRRVCWCWWSPFC